MEERLNLNAHYQRKYRENRFVLYQKIQERDYDRLFQFAEEENTNSKMVFLKGLRSLYEKVEDLEGEDLLDKGIKMQREWRMSMKEEPRNKGVS